MGFFFSKWKQNENFRFCEIIGQILYKCYIIKTATLATISMTLVWWFLKMWMPQFYIQLVYKATLFSTQDSNRE